MNNNENDINLVFDKMFEYYNVVTFKELAKKINKSASYLSVLRQRNSIKILENICYKIGIHEQIFIPELLEQVDMDTKNTKNEAEKLLEELFRFFKIGNYSQLALNLKISGTTIHRWENENNVDAILKRISVLGMYDEFVAFRNGVSKTANNDYKIPQYVLEELDLLIKRFKSKEQEEAFLDEFDEFIIKQKRALRK